MINYLGNALMKFYRVGGCVRDELMSQKPNDIDYLVIGGTPEMMVDADFQMVGKAFPVFLHPETRDEYALAQFNGESDLSITIEDDLSRRDLTINSMAFDEDGNLVDPFGGLKDIENKKLRHTGESFRDDPIRILRLARFKARFPSFEIHEDTVSFCKQMISDGLMDNLVKERVYAEIQKGLLTDKPSVFILALDQIGALEKLLPVIHNMKGVPQSPTHHSEGCVYTHTLMVIDEAAKLTISMEDDDKVAVCLAALFHDVGKTMTSEELLYDEDGNVLGRHHNHEDESVVLPLLKEVASVMSIPKIVFWLIRHTAVNHLRVHKMFEIRGSSFVEMANNMGLKSVTNNGNNLKHFNQFLLACKADALGREHLVDGVSVRPSSDYPQAERAMLYFEDYIDSEKYLVDWMRKYEEKFDRKPKSDLIFEMRTQLKKQSASKLKKKLDSEII